MPTKYLNLILFFLSIFLLISCTGYSVTGGPGKTVTPSLQTRVVLPPALRSVNSLLVAPVEFDDRARSGEQNELLYYRELENIAREEIEVEILAPEEILASFQEKGGSFSRKELIDLANSKQVDGILLTRLQIYQERVGSAVGATGGARVGIVMSVLRRSDNREVWKADFHFEDRALSDNLFELGKRLKSKRGRGWLSAWQVMTNGLQEACRDFNSRRIKAFSSS